MTVKYYTGQRKDGAKVVVAVTRFHGQNVSAKAVCNPADKYNEDTGRKYALARLNQKLDEKNVKYIEDCLKSLEAQYLTYKEELERKLDKANAALNKSAEKVANLG